MNERSITIARQNHDFGPNFNAPWPWSEEAGPHRSHPLSAEDRALLAGISTILRYKQGETIFREGSLADAGFNIVSGVVKSIRTSRTRRHVVALRGPGDLLGLPVGGRHAVTAVALTPVIMFKVKSAELEAKLRRHPSLSFQIICRLCLELGATLQHVFVLQRRVLDRVTMFLQLLESQQAEGVRVSSEIYLPMTRNDIAAYLGISAGAVTRALRTLQRQGTIRMRNARHVTILDRKKLNVT